LIYIASPYSHPDANVRQGRFEAACRAAAAMIREGHATFCPVAHSHPIALHGNLPGDFDYWEPIDREFLAQCDRVVVLALPRSPASRPSRCRFAGNRRGWIIPRPGGTGGG